MKKLAFCAAAAAICGSLLAVESANIVGYANKTLQNGFVATGANFVNANGAPMNLNDLKVVGYTDSSVEEVFLSKLDANGYAVGDILWAWIDLDDPDEGKFYGWYSDLGEGSDESLDIGEGVWIQAPSSAFSIQVSGQVYDQDLPIQLQQGFTMCANPAPIATLNLNSAIISGYTDSSVEEVFLSKLDANGYAVGDILWAWLDLDDPDEGTFYGWYSDLGEGSDEPLGLGEAVWIQAPSSDYYVTFPTAL